MVKHALRHALSSEIPHHHMDDLLITSMALHETLRHANILNLRRQSREEPHISPWSEICAEDNADARRFFGREEIAKIEDSQLVLQRLRDDMGGENSNPKVKRRDAMKVDPAQFQKPDRIIGHLGSGGFGSVEVRKWISDSNEVAIKNGILGPEEMGIQAKVRHPNLLPLLCCTWVPEEEKHNYKKDDRSLLLVTERMDGNLDNLIDKTPSPFPLHVSVEMMLQIAKGMEYLHGTHIIHRDLKPANILVNVNGSENSTIDPHHHLPLLRVKVADFGTSKDNFRTFDPNTYKVGSGLYRAPEILQEEGQARYSRKVDVYSFGMVSYRILTGKEPFEDMLKMHDHENPRKGEQKPVVGLLSPSITCPRALIGMVEQCWNHDPSRRSDFSQMSAFLRFIKICALQLIGVGLECRPDLVDVLSRDDLLRSFCESGCRLERMRGILVMAGCEQMTKYILEAMEDASNHGR